MTLEQEKNISDIFEIKAFTKKYKENFVVGFKKGRAERNIEMGVFIKLCHFKNHLPNFSLSGK